MKKLTYCIILIGLNIFFLACSPIKDVHYFKDKNSPIPNYYKIEISGYSFMAGSRYLSGYFDENAINSYFGEISQPENAKLPPDIQPLENVENSSQKLMLILSSNSNALAQQIGAIAQNEETMNALSQVLGKERIEESISINNEIKKQKFTIESFADQSDQYINSLDSNLSQSEVEKLTLNYLNYLAFLAGNKIPFDDIQKALKWFETTNN